MKKLFEFYFTIAEPASVVIAAKNEDEAEEIFDQMSNEEILERIVSAMEMGIDVVAIEDLYESEE